MSKTIQSFRKSISNEFSGFHFVPFLTGGVDELYKTITEDDLKTKIIALFQDPSQALTSVRVYPIKLSKFDPSISTPYSPYLRMVGRDWEILNQAVKPSFIFQATKPFTYRPNSNLDFAPFTSIQLYLPYLDFIELPVNEIIDKELIVYYAIDLSSGTATAYMELNSDYGKYIIATKTGKIGVDVAYGSTNNAENTRNILNAIATTGISLYALASTGGTSEVAKGIATVGKATAISKGALTVMNSQQLRYQRGGNNGSLGSMYAPQSPYIVIKKTSIVENTSNFSKIYGLPLYELRTLSTLHGFTVIDEIHLDNLPNATTDEYNEIEQLLKEGVHL